MGVTRKQMVLNTMETDEIIFKRMQRRRATDLGQTLRKAHGWVKEKPTGN